MTDFSQLQPSFKWLPTKAKLPSSPTVPAASTTRGAGPKSPWGRRKYPQTVAVTHSQVGEMELCGFLWLSLVFSVFPCKPLSRAWEIAAFQSAHEASLTGWLHLPTSLPLLTSLNCLAGAGRRDCCKVQVCSPSLHGLKFNPHYKTSHYGKLNPPTYSQVGCKGGD